MIFCQTFFYAACCESMKNTKEEKKDMKACNKSAKMVAFALAGLAAGAAVYYLLGTTEGRKTLNKAVDGVNDLSKNLKVQAEEGLHKATKLANKAKEEYERVVEMMKEIGTDAAEKAKTYKGETANLAKEGLNKAKSLKDDAKSYAKQGLEHLEETSRTARKKVDKA